MNSAQKVAPIGAVCSKWVDWSAAVLLAGVSAAVVVWQNSRLAVLWDLSYILENSYRISLGDMPYRDFPLPYAPLTFLTQAALIKLTGRVFIHHVVYCALVGGLASLLTWRILLNLLRGVTSIARPVALLLTLPLTVLGIYSVLPHPFYDPDCTFAVLVCILLLQQLEGKRLPPLRAVLTGMALVIPLLVKQNTGLAFVASAVLALAFLISIEAWRQRPLRGYLWLFVGLTVGLVLTFMIIQLTAGMGNYVRWTIKFAAARRTPSFADMRTVYENSMLKWWVVVFLAGALLLWLNRRTLSLLAGILMSVPFAWSVVYLLLDNDSSERAERLLALWPFLLIVSFVIALVSMRHRTGIALALPFILLGTVHGAFLSQQLWGSTYALWPLFIVLFGTTIAGLSALTKQRSTWATLPLAILVATSLLVSGGFYTWSHERLDYADLTEGDLNRSQLPALKGLSMRGSWIPDFEELVDFAEREIPPEDGILMIPGEDLFYFTTGRHPRFPVVMFDHTVNPYSAEEILDLTQTLNIRWLVIKNDLQLEEEPVENKDQLLNLLLQDFEPVDSPNNYEVYQRKSEESKR